MVAVGYIGIGAIGKAMATNVLNAGFPLVVYDIREEPLQELGSLGAKVARSPKEVAEQSDIIEISVVNDEQVEDVVLGEAGILQGARPGSIIAIHSTIHPKTAIRMGERAAEHGVGVVDAQVSGAVTGAINRTLLYMIGGEPDLVEQCKPIFATSGTTLVHLGRLGAGSTMRIVHHVMMALTLMAAREGYRLAEVLGLDLKSVEQAMHGGLGQSTIADNYLERYANFPTAGLCRIAEMAIPLANAHGVTLPAVALFHQLYNPLGGGHRH